MIITPTIVHKIRCSSVLTFVLLNKIWVNIAAFSNNQFAIKMINRMGRIQKKPCSAVLKGEF
jgi:hypothetical protein